MRAITYSPTLYDVINCQGGWDLETPTLSLPNGFVRDTLNFEVSQVKGGGYRRIDGYERFNGEPSPSDATFSIIQLESQFSTPGEVTPEGIVAASGGTGILIWIGTNYLVMTASTGAFTVGSLVSDLAANPLGVIATQTVVPTAEEIAIYTAKAADYYRTLVNAVPGSGPVRGVAVLPISNVDTVFAWRDNAGATACDIFKATVSGWSAVTLFNEVSFTVGGTAPPVEGDTLTQGGVTAVIKRVVHETGSWTGTSATGRLIIANPSGGNFAAGAATAPGVTLTLSGVQTAITLTAGGRYMFETHNFFGTASKRRLYGCSGVQKAFEFDGTVYVPINHNDANRFPSQIAVFKEHLFLGVESSVLHSGPGEPYKINAAAGGSEIALGDTVTNLIRQPGDAQTGSLNITTRSNAWILYGTSTLNWNLVGLNVGVMGLAYTGSRLNQTYWLDDNGITNLVASQNFGNFDSAMLTNRITSFIQSKRGFAVGSAVHREKSQYRLYFSDGSALYCTIVNGKLFGLMPQQLTDIFYCLWDGPSNDGKLYAGGSTSGYVYQLDVGTSFDGADIDAYLIFNWNPIKSPRILKRYRRASLEMEGGVFANIQFGYNLSYGRPGIPQDLGRSYEIGSSGVPFWDSFTWDNFFWDGNAATVLETEMRGSGENVQIVLRSGTDYTPSYTVNSIILHHTPRRGLR